MEGAVWGLEWSNTDLRNISNIKSKYCLSQVYKMLICPSYVKKRTSKYINFKWKEQTETKSSMTEIEQNKIMNAIKTD